MTRTEHCSTSHPGLMTPDALGRMADEMKRDMNLCRNILLSVEARESTVDPVWVELEGYTDGQIGYHAKLLADQSLLEGEDFTGQGDSTHCYRCPPVVHFAACHQRATWGAPRSTSTM